MPDAHHRPVRVGRREFERAVPDGGHAQQPEEHGRDTESAGWQVGSAGARNQPRSAREVAGRRPDQDTG